LRFVLTSLAFDALTRGPHCNVATTFGKKELEWWGYQAVKKV